MSKAKEAVANRPTEAVTGVVLAGAVYGFLTEGGVPHVIAAPVGAVAGFGPAFLSSIVDVFRGPS